jgi:hypothetical protein
MEYVPGCTAVVRRGSVEELVGHRNRALELYQRAAELISEANAAAQDAIQESYGGFTLSREDFAELTYKVDAPAFAAHMRKVIDCKVWRRVLDMTRIGSLMDASTRRKFEDQLHMDPLEFTVDNVSATLATLSGAAPVTFRQGLVTTFRAFSKDHRTNDAYKIGRKAIFQNMISWSGLSYGYGRRETVNDLERCFAVLDGKAFPIVNGIADAISSAHRDKQDTAENEYFKARWYGNGNLHLEFKRLDLVDRVNRLIAEHYGVTLAKETAPQKRHSTRAR